MDKLRNRSNNNGTYDTMLRTSTSFTFEYSIRNCNRHTGDPQGCYASKKEKPENRKDPYRLLGDSFIGNWPIKKSFTKFT